MLSMQLPGLDLARQPPATLTEDEQTTWEVPSSRSTATWSTARHVWEIWTTGRLPTAPLIGNTILA
jgi:hypothetical protein